MGNGVEEELPMLRQRTRKSILVLPDRVLRRIDRIRGNVGREEFLSACMDISPKGQLQKTRQKIQAYITQDELREFEQNLVMLLRDWVYLFQPSGLHAGAGNRITITEMEVRSRVKTGDTVPVYVTVCNEGAHQEMVEVTLVDISENVIIGRRTVTLLPGDSRLLHFDWKSGGFSLGDHILDATVSTIGNE